MSIMRCALEKEANNTLKIPHMNKEQLEKEDKLPRPLVVPKAAAECHIVELAIVAHNGQLGNV